MKKPTDAQYQAMYEAIQQYADDAENFDEVNGYAMGMCHMLQILTSTDKQLNDPNFESLYVNMYETLINSIHLEGEDNA